MYQCSLDLVICPPGPLQEMLIVIPITNLDWCKGVGGVLNTSYTDWTHAYHMFLDSPCPVAVSELVLTDHTISQPFHRCAICSVNL